jgi:group I intron endonuclease
MGYIYKLTSPYGKTYIGQTIRPIKERLEEHRKGRSKGCRAIYNAIKYHGWENFDKEWYEVLDDDLNFYEEMLVALLGTLSPSGYNLKEGGGSKGKMSEESKQKNRKAHIGKTLSKEHKQKIGDGQRGNPKSKEHKQKIGDGNRGKIVNKETRQKMSGENNPMYGIPRPQEIKQMLSEANSGENNFMYGKTGEKCPTSKRVYQYDMGGNILESFGSCEEAARELKKPNGSSIGACARGVKGRKTAHGFKWAYTKYEKLVNM